MSSVSSLPLRSRRTSNSLRAKARASESDASTASAPAASILQVQLVTACWSDGSRGARPAAASAVIPAGSDAVSAATRFSVSMPATRSGSNSTSRYSASEENPVERANPNAILGRGLNPAE